MPMPSTVQILMPTLKSKAIFSFHSLNVRKQLSVKCYWLIGKIRE
jgi:hypothetical protein